MTSLSSYLLPVLLLLGSNLFMTVAWYGHLKFESKPLSAVILASWGIAFFEYCLQVPANRWGHQVYSAPQLKGMQEVEPLGRLRADRPRRVADLPGIARSGSCR